MKQTSVILLGACVSLSYAGPGFSTCPANTPCYDMKLEKCKPGDSTNHNGGSLVYCDPFIDGHCDNKAACYGLGSGCVCTGERPCFSQMNSKCVAWTSLCGPRNSRLQWCPDSPPPATTTAAPVTIPPTTPRTTTPPSLATPQTNAPITEDPNIDSSDKPSSETSAPSKSPTTKSPPSTTKYSVDTDISTYDPFKVVDTASNTMTIMAIAGVVVVGLIVAGIVMHNRRRNTESTHSNPLPMYHESNPTPEANKVQTRTSLTANSNTHTITTSTTHTSKKLNEFDLESLDMHHISPSQVSIIKPLASGAYGEVLLAEFQGQFVAVKRLLPTKQNNKNELVKFIEEIKLHAKIDCAYIVQFVGASWTKPSDITMLTEYMDRGDLRNFLQTTSPATFTWTQKLQCALDIVQALVYLHSLDQKVIHRDLKSRNVLLNSSMQSKVTDFGVSREIDDFQTMTFGVGTFRWMAPEVLQDGHYETSADMFSYGVILSELDTHLLPYDGLRNERGNPYTDTAIIAKVMNGELKPQFSNHYPSWFSEIGMRCVSLNPNDRPTSMEAAYIIRVELQKLI